MKKENFEKNTIKEKYKDIISLIIIMILSFTIIFFFRLAIVNGHSMDKTLYDGQHLILSKKAYLFTEPEYGDIIVAEPKSLNGEYIIKRVIGTPGDYLEIKDNVVYINGGALDESYLPEPMVTEDLAIEIPEGKLFVMGDNRNVSGDSRVPLIGLIDIKTELKGKIILQFPF